MKNCRLFIKVLLLVIVFTLLSSNSAFASQSPLHTAKFFIFKDINACSGVGNCTHMTLSQTQVDTAASTFLNGWANYMNTNLGGKLTLVPQVVVVSDLKTIDFGTGGGWGWIPPAVLQTLIGDQVDKNVDIVLATSPTPNPAYCGLSDTDANDLSATYTYIFPGCISPADAMIHESIHLIQGGLENVMKRPDMYDVYHNYNGGVYPQALCGNTSPSDNYSWFPNIDSADKVPDFEACQSYYNNWNGYNDNYNNTNQAASHDGYNSGLYFYQGVLANHFPDLAHGVGNNYTGNHCRDGVQDYDETGIDSGGDCLTNIANPLPLYTPSVFTPTGWGTSSPGSSSNVNFSNPKFGKAWTIGATSVGAEADKIAIDTSNNLYYAGTINSSSVAYNPDGVSGVQTTTTPSIYLTKIASNGTYGFTYLFKGADSISVSSLKTDTAGNVYILGSFTGTVNFNPLGSALKSTGASEVESFLTKINANGSYGFTYVWPNIISLTGLTVGPDNSVYAAGNIDGTTDSINLDPTGGNDDVSAEGTKTIFYIKLDSGGNYVYSRLTSSSTGIYTTNLAVDSNSNLIMIGTFNTNLSLVNPSGSAYTKTAPNNSVFINKYDSSGNFVDNYTIPPTNDGDSVATTNLGIDESNNIYVLGFLAGTANFDPTGGTDSKTSAGLKRYITKIKNDGSYGYTLVWDNFTVVTNKITFDNSGKVYLLGESNQTANYDPNGGDHTIQNLGGSDNFMTILNPDGTYNNTYTWGGTGTDAVGDASFDTNGNLFIAGKTSGPNSNYDPINQTTTIPLKGNQDGFVMELTSATAVPNISAVAITNVTPTGVTVGWQTTKDASSKVDYGLTNAYGTSTVETDTSTRVSDHSVSLSSLVACTTYHFRARSKDAQTNEVIDTDNTFTTSGCAGSAPVTAANSTQVTTASGGSLSLLDNNAYGLTLVVPASFAASDANFQVHQLDKSTILAAASTPANLSLVNNYIYQLEALDNASATISTFDNALTVGMFYGASDISGFDESSLKIYRWDGADWTLLTGCTVDTQAKMVTCHTSNFSVFGLFGQGQPGSNSNSSNNNSSSSSNSGPTVCTNSQPSAPSIFQIWATKNQATMHFVPSQGDENSYTISYGPYSGADTYNTAFNYSDKQTAIPYTINALNPGTTYYFKVRANNGCTPGPWSNTLSLRTASSVGNTSKAYSYNASAIGSSSSLGGSCSEYTVLPGDSFWSIAQKLLGAGEKYFQLWNANKGRFPSLNSSSIIRTGWSISVGC